MLAVALGLSSSLCWGLADFFGGLQSRKRAALAVLLVSQGVALALLIPFAFVVGEEFPSTAAAGWAALAGAAGIVALGAFYRALAIGTMSVVAPISATAAAVPVLVGLVEGERPSSLQIAGMAIALGGVILASREPIEEGRTRPTAPRSGWRWWRRRGSGRSSSASTAPPRTPTSRG